MGTVNILGTEYPTIYLGNLECMASRLTYQIEGRDLYNKAGVQTIKSLLTNGWRIPTLEDDAAMFAVATSYEELSAYRTTNGWLDFNGTDTNGLHLYPGGYYIDMEGYGWIQVGYLEMHWLEGDNASNTRYNFHSVGPFTTDEWMYVTVRLVRDLPKALSPIITPASKSSSEPIEVNILTTPNESTVNILGDNYTIEQMPDGKWWMTQNLNWSGSGRANTLPLGRLYTWQQAMALIPGNGWRVPSVAEINAMLSACGYPGGIGGGALKSIGLDYWLTPNTAAANAFDFNVGGSGCWYNNAYEYQMAYGSFWTTDETSPTTVSIPSFGFDENNVTYNTECLKESMWPVRFVCDTDPRTYPEIHYTLDGTDPTKASPVYTEPLLIEENTTVKAYEVYESLSSSNIVSETYTFPPHSTTPIITPPSSTSSQPVTVSISAPPLKNTINILNNEYTVAQMPDGKWWITENLKYDGSGRWYNNGSIDDGYGKLYNNVEKNAISELLSNLSSPFRIANMDDWTGLFNIVGGGEFAGGVLKTSGTAHWNSPNIGASDSIGFGLRGAGYSPISNSYIERKEYTYLWCDIGYYIIYIGYNSEYAYVRPWDTSEPASLSIRLVSDTNPLLYPEIHYTLDGTAPTETSPIYNSPLLIEENTTINAYTIANGFRPSTLASETYTITYSSECILKYSFFDQYAEFVLYDQTRASIRGSNGLFILRRKNPHGNILFSIKSNGVITELGDMSEYNIGDVLCEGTLHTDGLIYLRSIAEDFTAIFDISTNTRTFVSPSWYGLSIGNVGAFASDQLTNKLYICNPGDGIYEISPYGVSQTLDVIGDRLLNLDSTYDDKNVSMWFCGNYFIICKEGDSELRIYNKSDFTLAAITNKGPNDFQIFSGSDWYYITIQNDTLALHKRDINNLDADSLITFTELPAHEITPSILGATMLGDRVICVLSGISTTPIIVTCTHENEPTIGYNIYVPFNNREIWKQVKEVWVAILGEWKKAKEVHVNNSGTWRNV